MIEAVQTNASPAAIWAIVAVAVACLAFWLVMVTAIAPRSTVRPRRGVTNRGVMTMTHSVVGGAHLAEGGRSVAPNRYAGVGDASTPRQAAVPAARTSAAPPPGAAAPAGGTRVPPSGAVRILGQDETAVPGQRPGSPEAASGADPGHVPPAQRTPDAGEAERSAAADKRQ